MQAEINLISGRRINVVFTHYVTHDKFMELFNGSERVLILWHDDASYIDIELN